MKNKVIDILSSYPLPKKVLAIGNEAVARGALEAGVDGVFSYPGTPSTEISEIFNFISSFQVQESNKDKFPEFTNNPLYFEYSINEKIALEKAIAYSIGNRSALCVMKNVGMNVASDPLMNVTYQTIIAPLVIVICDDPGCHSSSNEQDSRRWGEMASVPVFNPATPAEAHRMMKEAFQLSDQLNLPVIVRMTTRVSHSRGSINYGIVSGEVRKGEFHRMPEHINIPAKTSAAHQRLLDKLDGTELEEFFLRNNKFSGSEKSDKAVICSGVTQCYLQEVLHRNNIQDEIAVMEIGLIHPFPEKAVIEFLKRGFKEVLILEELDALIENAVRNLAQKEQIACEIFGKGLAGLKVSGEFSVEIIHSAIEEFTGLVLNKTSIQPLIGFETLMENLPPRPPALCAGCPHRATYYSLKLAIPRHENVAALKGDIAIDDDFVMCGDIGCFGLGALPPLKMLDTINHMGMSISMAQGLSEAFKNSEGKQKAIALIGDGTFFHSGVSSLLNAVYTRANLLLVIFDNRTIGMTGAQDHPGGVKRPKYHEIDIEPLVKGMGVDFAETLSPFDVKDTFTKVNKAIQKEGVSVLISKSPCVFLPNHLEIPKNKKILIDPNSCNNCHNQNDHSLACSRCHTSQGNLVRAKARMSSETHIHGREMLCPANICNHGFFNSILEGDSKAALEIVRDKMLFSSTCGDLCHRPCELFVKGKKGKVAPIRQLKSYVSSIEENFMDFDPIKNRIKEAEKKEATIAIVGAGPAGLSAAYDLVQQGYGVVVFDKEEKAGGMVRYAIPDFRMNKKHFEIEADLLADLGVEFRFGTSLGRDISLDNLSKEFNAVLIAIGMSNVKKLENVNAKIPERFRFDALSFLYKYNLNKLDIKTGARILVIGGGNSAMDAARTAKYMDENNEVIISCLEARKDMPAFSEEVEHAISEGIQLLDNTFVKNCSEDDENLRFKLNSHSEDKLVSRIEVDYVIISIGQDSNRKAIGDALGFDENNRLLTDAKIGSTGGSNVFAAGDICSGNHMSIIGAIASGKRAVVGIRRQLEGYQFDYEGLEALTRLNTVKPKSRPIMADDSDEELLENIKKFDLYQSCYKCNHCIDNFGCPAMFKKDGKVQIDDALCTKCGLCLDVCPNDAIKWVDIEALELVED